MEIIRDDAPDELLARCGGNPAARPGMFT